MPSFGLCAILITLTHTQPKNLCVCVCVCAEKEAKKNIERPIKLVEKVGLLNVSFGSKESRRVV